MPEVETIGDVAMLVIMKTRFLDEDELLARYEKVCNRLRIVPLFGQLRTALKRLQTEGRIVYVKGKGVKAK